MNRIWLIRFALVVPVLLSATPAALAQDKKPPAPAPAAAAAPLAAAPKAAPPAAAKPAAATVAPAMTAAPGAPAAAPAGPPPPKPPAELEQLKFLMGKWKCEGRQFASPVFGPEHTFKASAENKADMDGFWNQFTYEEKKSKEHHGFKVHGLWGWDQGSKHLVRAAVSNEGIWDTATSPGLEADKIVWTGELAGPMGRMPFRHTFTKKSDKEWSHMIEMKDPNGKWGPTEDVDCKR